MKFLLYAKLTAELYLERFQWFPVKHKENTDLRFLVICCWPNQYFLHDNDKLKVLRNVKLQNLKVLPSWR